MKNSVILLKKEAHAFYFLCFSEFCSFHFVFQLFDSNYLSNFFSFNLSKRIDNQASALRHEHHICILLCHFMMMMLFVRRITSDGRILMELNPCNTDICFEYDSLFSARCRNIISDIIIIIIESTNHHVSGFLG